MIIYFIIEDLLKHSLQKKFHTLACLVHPLLEYLIVDLRKFMANAAFIVYINTMISFQIISDPSIAPLSGESV